MLLSHSQMERVAPFYSTGWSAWEMTSIAAQSLTATWLWDSHVFSENVARSSQVGEDHGPATPEMEWINAEGGSHLWQQHKTTKVPLAQLVLWKHRWLKMLLAWLVLLWSLFLDYFNLNPPECLVFIVPLPLSDLTNPSAVFGLPSIVIFTHLLGPELVFPFWVWGVFPAGHSLLQALCLPVVFQCTFPSPGSFWIKF